MIEGICANAPKKQDNVLVEYLKEKACHTQLSPILKTKRYECALLRNKKQSTPVIPVFVADIDQHGVFKPFNFEKATSMLPAVPHFRKPAAEEAVKHLRYQKFERQRNRERDQRREERRERKSESENVN